VNHNLVANKENSRKRKKVVRGGKKEKELVGLVILNRKQSGEGFNTSKEVHKYQTLNFGRRVAVEKGREVTVQDEWPGDEKRNRKSEKSLLFPGREASSPVLSQNVLLGKKSRKREIVELEKGTLKGGGGTGEFIKKEKLQDGVHNAPLMRSSTAMC